MQNPNKKLFIACILCIFLFACQKNLDLNHNSEIDNVIETAPSVHSAVTANVNSNCAGYYKAVPARYDSSNKKYPLILFLHGIGELGNGSAADLKKMVRAGLPRLINKKSFSAFI